jgi:hypothetical protein
VAINDHRRGGIPGRIVEQLGRLGQGDQLRRLGVAWHGGARGRLTQGPFDPTDEVQEAILKKARCHRRRRGRGERLASGFVGKFDEPRDLHHAIAGMNGGHQARRRAPRFDGGHLHLGCVRGHLNSGGGIERA